MFQIALAYVLVTKALEVLPALEASLILLIEPVLNPVWAWVFQGERPGIWALVGGGIILGATQCAGARRPAGAGAGRGPGGLMPSLIETVRIRNGVAPLWYLHLRRLATSCRALGVPLPGELITPGGGADRIHRLEVGPKGWRSASGRSGAPPRSALALATVTHRAYAHKTTERDQFVARWRRPGRRRGRCAHADGRRVRGGVRDLGPVLVGGWPALRARARARGAAGVARARIEELTGGLVERRVRLGELEGRSLFVANAARGVVPVATLEGRKVPQDPGTAGVSGSFWP